MALDLTATSFGPALKLLYPNGLAEIMYENVPFVGWVPKDDQFYGEAKVLVPFISGTRGSNTFSNANEKGDVTVKRFVVTRVKDYAIASVDAETLMATRNDKGAVAKALDTQIRGAMYEMSRSAGAQVYGDGTGQRAVITAHGATTVTVAREDIVNFELGMALECYDDSGSALGTATSANIVTAIDRDAGTITFGGTDPETALGVTIENGADWLLREGDYNASAAGLQGWLPTTAPTAGDSFFSLDRSSDPVRLAGIRYVGSSSLLEETIMDACAYAAINGARPDTLFLNPVKFAQLNKSQFAKTLVDVGTDIPGIGYKALRIPTATGTIDVMPDPNCPVGKGFLLTKSSWELCSLGAFPHFAKDDGLKMAREAAADAVTFRIRAYWQLVCLKPGKNMVITW